MNLTTREIEIAELTTRGNSMKETADKLCLSEHTVRNHIEKIKDKTGARGVVDIARMFILSIDEPRKYFLVAGFLAVQTFATLFAGDMPMRMPRRNSSRKPKTEICYEC